METVTKIEEIGKVQYQALVTERLEKRTASLFEPIKRNKLSLFSSPPPSTENPVTSLKSNCSLFSRLHVSSQVRNGDLETFFCHENQSFPPALSQFGEIRTGTRSELLPCFEKISSLQLERSSVKALLLDGAAFVNMLNPGPSKTFMEYGQGVFLLREKSAPHVRRADVVCDIYIADSLKVTTRNKRGKGIRQCVKPDTKIPGNWAAS